MGQWLGKCYSLGEFPSKELPNPGQWLGDRYSLGEHGPVAG